MCLLQYFACKAVVINPMFVPYTFYTISDMNQWLHALCSFPMRFLQYFKCRAVVPNPMFVPNAISAISNHKSVVTNHMFVPNSISAVYRICNYKTRWSFPMRFLQTFVCKSMVTNPMFVPKTISAVFRM